MTLLISTGGSGGGGGVEIVDDEIVDPVEREVQVESSVDDLRKVGGKRFWSSRSSLEGLDLRPVDGQKLSLNLRNGKRIWVLLRRGIRSFGMLMKSFGSTVRFRRRWLWLWRLLLGRIVVSETKVHLHPVADKGSIRQ